jgi:hypothetical protein
MGDPAKREAISFRQRAVLSELKKEYVTLYAAAHARARLDSKGDRTKAHLLRDPRLAQLQKLSTIDLMPRQQLSDFQNRLASLQSCFALTQQDLDASPVCPHCNFRLVSEEDRPSAQLLKAFEAELDRMYDSWKKTLLNNLEDPTTQQNLALLKPATCKLIEAFLKSRTLPDEISREFIAALQEVLSGLTRVSVSAEDIKGALLSGGSPATIPELKNRFEEYLVQITKGKDPVKVRVVIE